MALIAIRIRNKS